MYKLILFLKQIHLAILFLAIELGAIMYFSHSSVYTNAKIMNVSNSMIGGIYGTLTTSKEYLDLKDNNEELSSLLALQLNEIELLKSHICTDSSIVKLGIAADTSNFFYMPAKVVNNSISRQYNYITISKGSDDGVEKDMAIISNNTVVGYIAACSNNYSVGVSILNRDFRSSGKDINNNYFGSLSWDGVNYKEVVLNDIPKYANVQKGDTIMTTSFSPRFPENLNIGIVTDFKLTDKMSYRAKIEIFTDMSQIYNVILVRNNNIEEITELETSVIDNRAND